ncbi:hypothetical protein RF11_14193 [Thelohanellus kitauei]|uniref:Uncharacterized protein n=1 Tax=Thelohanellus kitauei TaxID=669202 RepID=A0A0C2N2D7_THEKT|nr:hypothetical protein RF11_14193 [Thelohanellus kitauei]
MRSMEGNTGPTGGLLASSQSAEGLSGSATSSSGDAPNNWKFDPNDKTYEDLDAIPTVDAPPTQPSAGPSTTPDFPTNNPPQTGNTVYAVVNKPTTPQQSGGQIYAIVNKPTTPQQTGNAVYAVVNKSEQRPTTFGSAYNVATDELPGLRGQFDEDPNGSGEVVTVRPPSRSSLRQSHSASGASNQDLSSTARSSPARFDGDYESIDAFQDSGAPNPNPISAAGSSSSTFDPDNESIDNLQDPEMNE